VVIYAICGMSTEVKVTPSVAGPPSYIIEREMGLRESAMLHMQDGSTFAPHK